MMFKFVVLSVVLVIAQTADSLKLPNYIKPCSRNDPNLNQCALKNAKQAIPGILNGDRKYKIPLLKPFRITELLIHQDGKGGGLGLNFIWKNVSIHGIEKAKAEKVDISLDQRTIGIQFSVSQAIILAKYNVSGRILILPITGNGNANITLDNLNVDYRLAFDLVKKGPKGEVYMKPKKGDIKYDITKAYIKLENLFNGDKLLGRQMDIFLNENWKEVTQEVGPSIAQAIGEVIFQIISNICELVPYDNIFPVKV